MKMLTNLELSAFCSQLSMVLKAGISSAEGVGLLLQDAPDGTERDLLSDLLDCLHKGQDLSAALEQSGAFPRYLWKMVRIGESTGSTDDVLAGLSRHYARQESLSRSIRSAFTYPLLMCGVMALVVAVLLVKVMPVFAQVFRQLGITMSGFSRGALLLGQGLSRYAAVIVGILVIITVLFVVLMRSDNGRKKLKGFASHIRGIRDIFETQAACHFAGVLGLALQSGLTETEGFAMASNLNEDALFGQKAAKAKHSMDNGASLADAMAGAGMFTGMQGRLIAIAGRTGMLDEQLSSLSDEMEAEVDHKTNLFIGMLEPTLVILLSLIVGIILLSVMVPLLGILAGL